MSRRQIRPALVALICCLMFLVQFSLGENLSNVFVLDTSDSDLDTTHKTSPPPPSLTQSSNKITNSNSLVMSGSSESIPRERSYKEPDNTKIITNDDSSNGSDVNGRKNQQYRNPKSSSENLSRKLDEDTESQLHSNSNTRLVNSRNSQQQHTTNKPKQYNQTNNSKSKIEERLLIAIQDNYEDPSEQSSSLSSNNPSSSYDTSGTHSQTNHQHQKRKPAITITVQESKQDASISSGSAVIVRPSDDGHSIVIATVHHPNKHNNDKPQIVEQPLREPTNIPYKPQIVEPPMREPVNNPLQNIINQHQHVTTSTRRPTYVPSSSNVQRPPANNDEVPHLPEHTLLDNYGGLSTRPPPSGDYQSGLDTSSNNDQESTSSSVQNNKSKYPLNEADCGRMQGTRIVGGEEVNSNDYMWMAAIVETEPRNDEARPFCGGSLITRRHVLTAAHCLEGKMPDDVLIRLGSYDFDDSTASSLSSDYAIDQFRVPVQYNKKTHEADIAIMRLKTPLSSTDNYRTVCMPQLRRSYVGSLGTVTGYGSQAQTFKRASPKLRQVTVPIWENRKCSTVYKKNMTDSFLCAGLEKGGKDACQGDSGGPLMVEGRAQRLMIVGVVSHGIGCGSPGYPGVYTRTTTFLDWIEENTRS